MITIRDSTYILKYEPSGLRREAGPSGLVRGIFCILETGSDTLTDYTFSITKKIIYLTKVLILLFIMSLFTGCGNNEEDFAETAIIINSKGIVTNEIVEPFDKSYYDENELRDIIDKELTGYCRSINDEEACRLDSLSVREGVATARIVFSDYNSYAGFNEVDFFYGTINEAMEKGYPTDVTLKSSEDDSTISRYEFEALGEKRLVVVSEPVLVKLPGKIAYTTANIDLIDRSSARMASDSVGVGYIVLK